MTQPVQEPNQGRTNQGQEFRTRQLYRRPAPASGAMPWVLVTNFASPQALNNNDFTFMQDLVLEDFAVEDFVTISSSVPCGTDCTVSVDEPGLYLAQKVDELEWSSGGGPVIPDMVRTSFNGSMAPWTGSNPGDSFAYPSAQDDQEFVLMTNTAMFVVATTASFSPYIYMEDATGDWIGYTSFMITRISA